MSIENLNLEDKPKTSVKFLSEEEREEILNVKEEERKKWFQEHGIELLSEGQTSSDPNNNYIEVVIKGRHEMMCIGPEDFGTSVSDKGSFSVVEGDDISNIENFKKRFEAWTGRKMEGKIIKTTKEEADKNREMWKEIMDKTRADKKNIPK